MDPSVASGPTVQVTPDVPVTVALKSMAEHVRTLPGSGVTLTWTAPPPAELDEPPPVELDEVDVERPAPVPVPWDELHAPAAANKQRDDTMMGTDVLMGILT
jgi:hypothetical protein